MRICLVAEGSYPYVTGGVSSWISQLMHSMPEHEFVVVAITPDSAQRGQYRYQLPPNLVALHDVFLDELLTGRAGGRQAELGPEDIALLGDLMHGRLQDWPALFRLFRKLHHDGVQAMDILTSRVFFDLVRAACAARYPELPFTPLYWTMHSMYLLLFALMLAEYPPADIYHAVSTGYAGMVGACAASLGDAAFLLTEHGIYTREREEEIIKADWVKGYFKNIWIDYFRTLSRCAYLSAEKVVALFERNREIQHELGCPKGKTLVIHNGIRSEAFEPIAEAVRRRPGRDSVRIGAIIRVVPVKDIKTMLQAFALVSRRLPETEFLVMGPTNEDPEYYESCRQHLQTLGLRNVRFTGTVDVRGYLSELDMLVLTSISEGQPLAILEGLASTLPVVATDVGDCRALIDGHQDTCGPAGRVVPIMDPSAVADALADLAENPTMRRQMGENGYLRVRSGYSFQAFIDAYRDLYRQHGRGGS